MTTATTAQPQEVSLDELADHLASDTADLDAELIRIERAARIYEALNALDELTRWIICRHTGFPLEPGDEEQRAIPVRELAAALKRRVSKRFTIKYTEQAIDYGIAVLADELADFKGLGF